MLKAYRFSEEVSYIPMILNLMVFKKDFFAKNNMYVSKAFLSHLKEKICQEVETDIIILDFEHIILGEPGSLKEFCLSLQACIRLVIYSNLNDKIYGLVEAGLGDNACGAAKEKVISNAEGFTYYTNFFKPFREKRNEKISNIVKIFLKNTCINEESYLASSNLYANKYVNIKNIFTNQDIYYLVLIQLFNLISLNFNENEYDKLVCVSLNGAVVATLLGQMINKKVIYLMNLGPNLNIRDKESLGKIKVSEKYLFIADMLCTGTELKVAETITNYRSAEIVGALVVAQYLKAMSSIPVCKIFEINDGDDFDYKVYSKKI